MALQYTLRQRAGQIFERIRERETLSLLRVYNNPSAYPIRRWLAPKTLARILHGDFFSKSNLGKFCVNTTPENRIHSAGAVSVIMASLRKDPHLLLVGLKKADKEGWGDKALFDIFQQEALNVEQQPELLTRGIINRGIKEDGTTSGLGKVRNFFNRAFVNAAEFASFASFRLYEGPGISPKGKAFNQLGMNESILGNSLASKQMKVQLGEKGVPYWKFKKHINGPNRYNSTVREHTRIADPRVPFISGFLLKFQLKSLAEEQNLSRSDVSTIATRTVNFSKLLKKDYFANSKSIREVYSKCHVTGDLGTDLANDLQSKREAVTKRKRKGLFEPFAPDTPTDETKSNTVTGLQDVVAGLQKSGVFGADGRIDVKKFLELTDGDDKLDVFCNAARDGLNKATLLKDINDYSISIGRDTSPSLEQSKNLSALSLAAAAFFIKDGADENTLKAINDSRSSAGLMLLAQFEKLDPTKTTLPPKYNDFFDRDISIPFIAKKAECLKKGQETTQTFLREMAKKIESEPVPRKTSQNNDAPYVSTLEQFKIDVANAMKDPSHIHWSASTRPKMPTQEPDEGY